MPVDPAVRELRSFSRFYTTVLGLLDDGLLQTRFSLPESRVIFELGTRGGSSPSELADELQLDPGYVSRLLSGLKRRRIVTTGIDASDGRRKVITLSKDGRKAFRALDRASTKQAVALLAALPGDGRERLITSTKEIRQLLGPREPHTIVLRAPTSGDYGWVIERHGAIYRQEFGWDEDFEGLVARIVADYLQKRDPERESAWIAEVDGHRVGCIFCTKKRRTLAQLRILLVEPSARGLGIGSRLVDECINFARRTGYKQMMLWTNDVLTDARRIYERAGFQLMEEEKHHSFGRDLVGQNWMLDL
ncbi:MAG: GNAT family N-acetyltransferase [Actinomycetota bacterium]